MILFLTNFGLITKAPQETPFSTVSFLLKSSYPVQKPFFTEQISVTPITPPEKDISNPFLRIPKNIALRSKILNRAENITKPGKNTPAKIISKATAKKKWRKILSGNLIPLTAT